MPITPTVAQLSGGAPGLGDMLNQQQQTETEEEKKRRRMRGLAAGSATEQAFLGAAAQFNVGGLR